MCMFVELIFGQGAVRTSLIFVTIQQRGLRDSPNMPYFMYIDMYKGTF